MHDKRERTSRRACGQREQDVHRCKATALALLPAALRFARGRAQSSHLRSLSARVPHMTYDEWEIPAAPTGNSTFSGTWSNTRIGRSIGARRSQRRAATHASAAHAAGLTVAVKQ